MPPLRLSARRHRIRIADMFWHLKALFVGGFFFAMGRPARRPQSVPANATELCGRYRRPFARSPQRVARVFLLRPKS